MPATWKLKFLVSDCESEKINTHYQKSTSQNTILENNKTLQ